jgi:putative ABC transport system permease protein
MLRDVRFALRTLLKNRVSTLLVISVLALGIAAGTVVLSAVRSVSLIPAAVPHPEELVVVLETEHYALDREAGPLIYLPFAQVPQLEMRIALRTQVEPRSLAGTVVRELRPLNRDQAAFNMGTMEEMLSQRMGVRRFTTAMLGALALAALLVAAVGVFGVLSYAVSRRTQEIGIRMALGAQPFAVRRMVVGEGMRLVLRGLAIGAVLAAPAADLLSSLIFGLKAADLPVLAGVSAVPILAALLACYLPARKASSVDPMVALRHY